MRVSRAAIAAFCIFLLYLCVPTRTYYWDGVLFSFYAEQARSGAMSWNALYHPNHLIYTLFAYLVSIPGVRTIHILQALNALAGAVCCYVVYLLAKRITRSGMAPFAAMLLFACGATWWKFATDADAYILSVLFCSLAVLSAIDNKLFFAIAGHVIAMLFHQLAIFVYFPVVLALRSKRDRIAYTLSAGTAIAVGYVAAFRASQEYGHEPFLRWITSYASDTPVTHSAAQIFGGYLSSYVKLFAGGKPSMMKQFAGPVMALALGMAVVLLVLAIGKARERNEAGAVRWGLLWAWLIPSAIFLAGFDPGSNFHKLFIWPPIVLLICAGLRHRAKALAAFAGGLACWNFGAFIWPHAHESADPVITFAHKVSEELPQGATLYYAAFSPDDWYLRYFGSASWHAMPPPHDQAGPVCYETTALNANPQLWAVADRKWSLTTAQHNIRIGCVSR